MYRALCVFSVNAKHYNHYKALIWLGLSEPMQIYNYISHNFMYSALCVFSVCMQTITTTREALERVGVVVVVVVQPVYLHLLCTCLKCNVADVIQFAT